MSTVLNKVFQHLPLLVLCLLSSMVGLTQNQYNYSKVVGEVINTTSYWNTNKTNIYTLNTIKVDSVLDGNPVQNQLDIITEGGIVNNTYILSGNAAEFKVGDKGEFTIKESTKNAYKLVGKKKGYKAILLNNTLTNQTFFTNNQVGFQITDIIPLSVAAGVGDTVSIIGNGFGTTQASGKVLFRNARIPEYNASETLQSDSVLWSDTLIKVKVPNFSKNNFGTAGTGVVRVKNDTGYVYSSQTLNVRYSRINTEKDGLTYRPKLVNKQNGGYVFTMNNNIATNTNASSILKQAMEQWVCASSVNWQIDSTTTNEDSMKVDGINLISFSSDVDTGFSANVLLVFKLCGGDQWHLDEVDVVFKDTLTWNFTLNSPYSSQMDFYSVALNYFGYAHLLDWVIGPPGTLMDFQLNYGEYERTLGDNEIEGANFVMTESVISNSCGPQQIIPKSNCYVGVLNDIGIERIASHSSKYHAGNNQDVVVKLFNESSDTLTTADLNWSINNNVQAQFNWSGSLPPHATEFVTIGTYDFPIGVYDIKAWTSNPNGGNDPFSVNDTAKQTTEVISYGYLESEIHFTNANSIAEVDGNCDGFSPVKARFRVKDSNTIIDSLFSMVIYWKVNGVQQPTYYWTGEEKGYINYFITLGEYFSVNTYDTIEMWTGKANGKDAVMDSISFYYNGNGLSGDYTIDTANADFTDVNDFKDALYQRGLCGPTTLNLKSGYSTAVYLYASPPNSSSVNTLTFQSETNDSTDATLGYFRLKNTSNVILKHLTVYHPSGATRVKLEERCENIVISNNQIVGTTNSGWAVDVSDKCNNLWVKNNLLEVEKGGVKLLGLDTSLIDNVVIDKNIFNNLTTSLFNIKASYVDSLNVTDNIITGWSNLIEVDNITGNFKFNLNKSDALSGNIEIEVCKGEIELLGNHFYNTDLKFLHMDLTDTCRDNLEVSNNLLLDTVWAHSSMLFNGVNCIDGNCFITNNGLDYLDVLGSKEMNFINNTVFPNGMRIEESSSWYGDSSYHISLYNNLIVDTNNFHALLISDHDIIKHQGLIKKSDNNCFFSNSNLALSVDTGGSPVKANSTDILKLFHKTDSSSIIKKPSFVGHQLHLASDTSNCGIIGGGKYFSEFASDIDGDLRDVLTSDIGIDEVQYSPIDFLGLDTAACGSKTLTSAIGESYLWNTGDTTQSIIVDSTGYYWVDVVNSCDVSSDSIYVVINPVDFTAIPIITPTGCDTATGSVDINASGGTSPYAYLWDDTNTQITQVATGLVQGYYNVTLTDSVGCEAYFNVLVPDTGSMVASTVITDATCYAGNDGEIDLSITGGTQPYQYEWSNSSTTQDVSSLIEGLYIVTITDANGCELFDTSIVVEPDLIVNADSLAGDTCSISNGYAYLSTSGGAEPYTYLWSNSSTDDNITGVVAGAYYVTTTDAVGCSIQDTVIITNTPIVNTFWSLEDKPDCHDACDGGLDISVSNGSGGYSYSWSNGQTVDYIKNICSGTYTVTVTDKYGCTSIDSIFLDQPDLFDIDDSVTPSDSFSCTGTATVTVLSGGTLPYYYDWSNGQTTATATDLCMEGNYCVTITDIRGCDTVLCFTVPSIGSSSFINSNRLTDKIRIFPNPTKGKVTVVSSSFNKKPIQYIVRDNKGKIALTGVISQSEEEVSLNTLAPDVYYIQFIGKGIREQHFLIIAK